VERRNNEGTESNKDGRKRLEDSKRGKGVKELTLCHRTVLWVEEYSLHRQMSRGMEAEGSSETLVPTHKATRCLIRVYLCADYF
jgi:hypothetical protein